MKTNDFVAHSVYCVTFVKYMSLSVASGIMSTHKNEGMAKANPISAKKGLTIFAEYALHRARTS